MSYSPQASIPASAAAPRSGASELLDAVLRRVRRPELLLLVALAAALNLWALARNGWANDYYAAAVRSMSSSWHDFLFASLDHSGVMTVDKPPLSLWVQALSVRAFGYHPLSVLVPQALMGVASVVLLYDLVRRRFGRLGGFVAGLALALTPIAVAVSRHNNPDALLVLCCVAALWCAVRALEHGRTRWLVLAGVCVGLGFETKMGVALVVVPGIALAWLWAAPAARGRLHALRQLLAGGVAMVLVGGAWPALVELVPAAERPWVSGTSDNRVLSLIFEYNGLGRVDGQAGGPGGIGGSMFGGAPGPLRLLGEALGGQVGWLLGFVVVGGLAILASCRLRRADARTGWLIAVGGAFATTAVLFSAASGIFHPYYVSLLAPFAAALVGAGAAQLADRTRSARVLAPLAIAAGVIVELVVRSRYPGQLSWLAPVLVPVAVAAAVVLAVSHRSAPRRIAMLAAVGALLLAPAAWALDTLGYATSGTFPAGGPQDVASGGFGGPGGSGGPGGAGRAGRFGGAPGSARASGALRASAEGGGTPPLFGGEGAGAGQRPGESRGTSGGEGGETGTGGPPGGGPPGAGGFGGPAGGGGGPGAGGGAIGGPFGQGESLTAVLSYVKAHGGGTIAVSSQSSAASAIIEQGASVAGIGGFSGRESDVSVSWLAQEVAAGRIRWVLVEGQGVGGGRGGFGAPGDTRTGSQSAMAAAAKACKRLKLNEESSAVNEGSTSGFGGSASAAGTLYDCHGRASAILAQATIG
jgi:4-amino-4-deoxy-L-arabinose transferase-like glycosyltransferase